MGWIVGLLEGANVGILVGDLLGTLVGTREGALVGGREGALVGDRVGCLFVEVTIPDQKLKKRKRKAKIFMNSKLEEI